MEAGQAANQSRTIRRTKVMCRHMYDKVSKATPQLVGLEMTECGLFNRPVLGEVHGSAASNDLKCIEPAECGELCAYLQSRR